MRYDQRPEQARTDTTRHLRSNETDDSMKGLVGYLEGARQRSSRFADATNRLREIRADIDSSGRDAQSRPTGILSGGDIDIAYHYLGLGMGVIALLYSMLGSIFMFHNGGEALVAAFTAAWAAGPAAALSDTLLNARTIGAIALQAILFIVLIGTRRNQESWQHRVALISSLALTYAGWSSLLVAYGTPPLAAFTTAIPGAVLGGAMGWAVARAGSETPLSRTVMFAVIGAGVVAGALGVTTLIHWIGLLLAWGADQAARRLVVIG